MTGLASDLPLVARSSDERVAELPVETELPGHPRRLAEKRPVRAARISVIMPLYNKAPFVEKAIRSALDHGEGVIEVIVVDDGSRDDGAAIVESIDDDRIRLIRQANGGVSAARNVGLDLARGDWLAFLDADDYWLPGYIDAVQAMIAQFPQCGMVTTRYQFEDDDGKRSSVDVQWPFETQAPEAGNSPGREATAAAGPSAASRSIERARVGHRAPAGDAALAGDAAPAGGAAEAGNGVPAGDAATASETAVLVDDFYGSMSLGHFCYTCSVVIRRDIVRREGLRFPVGEQMGEDLEVIFSAAEAAPVAVDPRELVVYRDSNQGLRLSRGRLLDNLLLPFFQRLVERLETGQMPDSMRAGAEAYLRSHMKFLVTYAARHNRRREGFRLIRNRLISRHPDTLIKALITLLLPPSLVNYLKARLK